MTSMKKKPDNRSTDMNEMRKLMEAIKTIEEAEYIRYDPQPGDDEPLIDEYDDEPDAIRYTRLYGTVTVKVDKDEVLLTHGHNENIYLTKAEWKEFAGEIKDILI